MAVNKIVIIGAGSTEFTPGLLADLVTSPNLRSLEIALVDIDAVTVDTMTRLAQRMSDAKGAALKISGTTDRREALLRLADQLELDLKKIVSAVSTAAGSMLRCFRTRSRARLTRLLSSSSLRPCRT